MDVLGFANATLDAREGVPAVQFLDLLVNGSSLRARIGEDLLLMSSTPLTSGWTLSEGLKWLGTLSDGRQATLQDGRIELYVCRDCGDLACGALTVNIERTGSLVRWDQFGWEDGLTDEPYDPIDEPLEFGFDGSEYDATLRAVRERLMASQRETPPTRHLWWREQGFAAIDM